MNKLCGNRIIYYKIHLLLVQMSIIPYRGRILRIRIIIIILTSMIQWETTIIRLLRASNNNKH